MDRSIDKESLYKTLVPLVLSSEQRVSKVWGSEYWVVNTENYCLKVLIVQPGYQCSLHRHSVKDETFIVLFGEVNLEQRDVRGFPSSEILRVGDQRHIAPRTLHRFGSVDGAVLMEVSTHHEDADSYRITESGPICQSETSQKS